jgi:hypothetical protein
MYSADDNLFDDPNSQAAFEWDVFFTEPTVGLILDNQFAPGQDEDEIVVARCGYPASSCGVRAGDVLLSIESERITLGTHHTVVSKLIIDHCRPLMLTFFRPAEVCFALAPQPSIMSYLLSDFPELAALDLGFKQPEMAAIDLGFSQRDFSFPELPAMLSPRGGGGESSSGSLSEAPSTLSFTVDLDAFMASLMRGVGEATGGSALSGGLSGAPDVASGEGSRMGGNVATPVAMAQAEDSMRQLASWLDEAKLAVMDVVEQRRIV